MSRLLVLYASQTGTAQECAERVARQAERGGLSVACLAMDAFMRRIAELPTQQLVLFVTATTGDGDPPDNMRDFWTFLLNRALPSDSLSGVRAAVFGLGDSSYAKFNHAARKLHARLAQLGAQELCARGLGDEQSEHGIEGDLDAWLTKSFWPAIGHASLQPTATSAADAAASASARSSSLTTGVEPAPKFIQSWSLGPPQCNRSRFRVRVHHEASSTGVSAVDAMSAPEDTESAMRPFLRWVAPAAASRAGGSGSDALVGRIVANNRLTAPGWTQDTRHVAIALASSARYRAGDVCVLMPCNSTDHPRRLAARLGLDWDTKITIECLDHTTTSTMSADSKDEDDDTDMQVDPLSEVDQDETLRAGTSDADALLVRIAGSDGSDGEQHHRLTLRLDGDVTPFSPAWTPPSGPITVGSLFTRVLDIEGIPRRSAFEQLSFFATDEEERDKLRDIAAIGGSDLYAEYAQRERRSWAEVIEDFASLTIPLPHLLELIPPLRPRSYSIASAPTESPHALELCIAIATYRTPFRRTRIGTTSAFIAAATIPTPESGTAPLARRNVRLWIVPGSLPSLPPIADRAPSILIGPGTGIAPLRSLIRERWAQDCSAHRAADDEAVVTRSDGVERASGRPQPGAARLYFGSRGQALDFYYASEWQELVRAGGLDLMRTAFSRDQADKIYVQGRLAEDAAAVAKALCDPRCIVLIAGSAKRMPADVRDIFLLVLQRHAAMTAEQAAEHLTTMERERRYVIEAWS